MGSAIPRSMDQLTPQWLTGALREGGVIRDASVTSARCEGIGVGAGFLGQLGRLKLEYDRPEPSAPAVAHRQDAHARPRRPRICGIFQFYEREIRFYDQCTKGIEVRVPKRYYSAMDKAADDYLILIEEITDAQMIDEVAGCTAEQAEQAIRAIAKFQASWWASPKLEQLAWMPYANSPVQQAAEPSYNQAWEPFLAAFGDQLSPAMREIAAEMRTHVVGLLDELAKEPTDDRARRLSPRQHLLWRKGGGRRDRLADLVPWPRSLRCRVLPVVLRRAGRAKGERDAAAEDLVRHRGSARCSRLLLG